MKRGLRGFFYRALICAAVCSSILSLAGSAGAKVKEIQKPDGSYDFKAVQLIVVDPMTSDNVDFGKVDADRMPKIQALLEKTKKNLRDHMVKGAKISKTSIPFAYKAPNRKNTTLVLKYNIEQFDNGNAATRLIPTAGKAKVKFKVQFVNAQTKAVVAEVEAEAKAKGGLVGGGSDSEVLWSAANMANSDVYRYIKKQTGLTYDYFAGIGEGMKMGTTTQVDMMKEEGKEKEVMEKKSKKK